MFTADLIIDTVQTAKKQAVKTLVQNESIAKSMNEFVDAQTAYTKSAVKAGTDAFTTISSELVKTAKAEADKLAKGEYFKDFTKAFAK